MKRIHLFPLSLLCLLLCLLGSCGSHRSTSRSSSPCLSAKVALTLPYQGRQQTLRGQLRLVSGEQARLTLLMPLLRTEVVRLDLTPDTLLLVDRMGHRYVRASRQELRPLLPRRATFAQLERLLQRAARSGREARLTAAQLGLPRLEGAQIVLTDFSHTPFTLSPTRLSSRYQEVPIHEWIHQIAADF